MFPNTKNQAYALKGTAWMAKQPRSKLKQKSGELSIQNSERGDEWTVRKMFKSMRETSNE